MLHGVKLNNLVILNVLLEYFITVVSILTERICVVVIMCGDMCSCYYVWSVCMATLPIVHLILQRRFPLPVNLIMKDLPIVHNLCPMELCNQTITALCAGKSSYIL